jgi:hypothetical protein
VNVRVEGKFCSREMFSSVLLMVVTKEAYILFNFLVLTLGLALIFRILGNSEANLDSKVFIESAHELGCKLWSAVGEDFLQNFVEAEHISIVKISSTLSC